jgi:hypothetical protein
MDEIKTNKSLDIKQKIDMIMRQTDYDEETALNKLTEFHFNEINVIKSYLSIDLNVQPTKYYSLNQEIYKQIRNHLNQPNNSEKYLKMDPKK